MVEHMYVLKSGGAGVHGSGMPSRTEAEAYEGGYEGARESHHRGVGQGRKWRHDRQWCTGIQCTLSEELAGQRM
jgi:hypothetical protein